MASPELHTAPQSSRRLSMRVWLSVACLTLLAAAALWIAQPWAKTTSANAAMPRFAAGQRLIYQLEFSSASISDFGALFAEGPSTASHAYEAVLEGELAVTVLQADPQRVDLVYQLSPAEVQLIADGQDALNPTIRANLARPVFAVLDGRGKVLSVRFDPAADKVSQHLLRTLLAATQLVGPADAQQGTTWESEEDDPTGAYAAQYEMQDDGTVRKSKVRYLQRGQAKKRPANVMTPTVVPEGTYVMSLDRATGCLAALSASETQMVTLKDKTLGEAEMALEMRLVRNDCLGSTQIAALREQEAEFARTAPAVPLSIARSAEASRFAIQRQELGDATLPSLLDDLARIEADPQDKDMTRLFLKFKALTIVRPESCGRLGELLAAAPAESLRMRLFAEVLQAAGHADAQAALAAAIRARAGDWPVLAVLIPALGTAPSATPQTEQILEALAFGGSDAKAAVSARLALGNLAANLREEHPARASRIAARLLKELEAATDAESRWQLLLALGNAGAAEALPTLTRYLDDASTDLRGAAAWALRFLDAPEVDVLLTTKTLADREPAVRLDAARALRFRGAIHTNLVAQEKALATESEAGVRLLLLGNLWEARAAYPRAQQLVEQAAAGDASEEVRNAAAAMVESAQPSTARE